MRRLTMVRPAGSAKTIATGPCITLKFPLITVEFQYFFPSPWRPGLNLDFERSEEFHIDTVTMVFITDSP